MDGICTAPDGDVMYSLGFTPARAITYMVVLGFIPLAILLGGPKLVRYLGSLVGQYVRNKTAKRREQILSQVESDRKAFFEAQKNGDRDNDEWEHVEAYEKTIAKKTAGEKGEKGEAGWDGIVGFFHPFCNAWGGGERVLWAAVKATQKRWPAATCVVYTGDHDVDKATILARVQTRFNIRLHTPSVVLIYLTKRRWVLASAWPRFTLLGQSLGSIVLAWDAFSLLPPDIFVDTMGYAFALGFAKLLFRDVPTGAYVHFPTISTDMLGSLEPKSADSGFGVNAGKGAGARGFLKKKYWEVFAWLYSIVGASIDVVMTNSSWTLSHIKSLWGPWRAEFQKSNPVVVYPPCAVEEIEAAISMSVENEKERTDNIVYIAQFRPEKDHTLIITAFAEFMAENEAAKHVKLILIGSVRDDADSKRVLALRLLANELQIKASVEFHIDASWPEILKHLGKASIGVNGMWNEHFGIGVVEYQAAGLVAVVHSSGGPKRDIVIPIEGSPSGFLATTSTEFATAFNTIITGLRPSEKAAYRLAARRSAQRFTEAEFAAKWVVQMEKLVGLRLAKMKA